MCLIFLAIDAHPKYPVVIAANRDEFYERPTAPASFWPDAPRLLAGRDLRAGGTWLGITRTGRISALTNYRDPRANKADAPSRGMLTSDFLLSTEDPMSYLRRISGKARRYNAFNLLVGRKSEFYWHSNVGDDIQALSPGIHGLSNHSLDTAWPKVQKGKEALRRLLASEDFSPESLFQLLLDRTVPKDDSLPDTSVGLEWERILSPAFITSQAYGTRSSTVILLDRSGTVLFIERSFQKAAGAYSAVEYSFKLEAENR